MKLRAPFDLDTVTTPRYYAVQHLVIDRQAGKVVAEFRRYTGCRKAREIWAANYAAKLNQRPA